MFGVTNVDRISNVRMACNEKGGNSCGKERNGNGSAREENERKRRWLDSERVDLREK